MTAAVAGIDPTRARAMRFHFNVLASVFVERLWFQVSQSLTWTL